MAEDSVVIVAIVVILVIVAAGFVYAFRDRILGIKTVEAVKDTIIERQFEKNTTIIKEPSTKEKETIREERTTIIVMPQFNNTNST